MGEGYDRRQALRIASSGLVGVAAGPAVAVGAQRAGGPRRHSLMITGNGPVEYALAVDGTLELDTEGGDFSAEGDETVTRGGVVTASDTTGPVDAPAGGTTFMGDRYRFTGSIDRLDLDPAPAPSTVRVYFDERHVRPGYARSLGGLTDQTHSLMIAANGPVDYRLDVDGTLEPDTEGGDFSAESGDDVTRDEFGRAAISDRSGAGDDVADDMTFMGDRFLFDGSVERLDLDPGSVTGEVNLYLDERLVSRRQVLNA